MLPERRILRFWIVFSLESHTETVISGFLNSLVAGHRATRNSVFCDHVSLDFGLWAGSGLTCSRSWNLPSGHSHLSSHVTPSRNAFGMWNHGFTESDILPCCSATTWNLESWNLGILESAPTLSETRTRETWNVGFCELRSGGMQHRLPNAWLGGKSAPQQNARKYMRIKT